MKIEIIFLPAMFSNVKFERLEVPPLSIYLLAGILKSKGFSVSTIDPCEFTQFEFSENLIEKCTHYIENKTQDADVLAFSTNSFNWGITKMVINKFNNIRGVPIILGGLHPSIFDEYALKTTKANFVLRGEGEQSLPELINGIKNNQYDNILGLSYIKNGKVVRTKDRELISKEKLQKSPYPLYSLIPTDNNYKQLSVESSRGCKFSCAFCSIPHRYNWRGFDCEEVVKRVKHAVKITEGRISTDRILFVDDCFTINAERTIEILNSLYKEFKGKKHFFIEVRISDLLKKNFLGEIPRNILYGIQIGVECGYDEGLKRIRKGLTIKQLYKGLELIHKVGYDDICMLSFIIGFPWEGKEEIRKTLDIVEDIAKKYDVLCNLNWLMLLPSDLWEDRNKYDINVDESIFDDPLWVLNKHYFKAVHPRVTEEIFTYVDRRIQIMQEKFLNVSYNRINLYSKQESYMNRL